MGAAARLITVGATFALTPVTLARAGLTTYGLFAALTAFASLLAFSDLGLANGLIDRLSSARVTGDRRLAASALSNTLAILVLVALALGFAGTLLAQTLPWHEILNGDPSRQSELRSAVMVCAWSLAFGVPGGLATKIYWSLLKPAVSNLWLALGALSSAVVVALVAGQENPLPLMVAGQVGVPGAFGFAGLVTALWREELLSIDLRLLRRDVALSLLISGRLFAFLQIAALISYQIDALIIVRLLGPEEAAIFAACFKFFSLPVSLLSFFMLPLWPAFADARMQKDFTWMASAYRKAWMSAMAISFLIAPALVLAGPQLIRLWTGGRIDPPFLLLIAGAAWVSVSLITQPQAMLMNSLRMERFQVSVVSVTVAANVTLSIGLTHTLGVSGPLLGTVVSLALLTLLPTGVWLRRYFRNVDSAGAQPSRRRS